MQCLALHSVPIIPHPLLMEDALGVVNRQGGLAVRHTTQSLPHTDRWARHLRDRLVRPLIPEEVEQLREAETSCPNGASLPVCVELALAGGTASEIAEIRRKDIDLGTATVSFGGCDAPNNALDARTNPLDEWGLATIEKTLRWRHVAVDERVCVRPTVSSTRAAPSVTVRLAMAIRRAGLHRRPGVTAKSIRLAAGLQILRTEGIAAAARFLGVQRLDIAARALHHDWWRDGDV